MKKLFMGLFVLFIGLIFITGCGNTYDGKADQIKGLKELKYEIPDGFKEKEDNALAASYTYDENEMNCNITIQSADKKVFTSYTKDSWSKSVTEDLQKGYKVVADEYTDINGLEAKHVQLDGDVDGTSEGLIVRFTSVKHFYFIENDNYLYKIKYEVFDNLPGERDDLDTHLCMTSFEPFINSLGVK